MTFTQRYGITHWGEGYFQLNSQGQVSAQPNPKQPEQEVTLDKLVHRAKAQGLQTPLLLRFPAIITHRINRICQAFNQAMNKLAYQADFTAVYPIKVNQQIDVAKTVIAQDQQVGLEAGSKPELLAVLALDPNNQQTIVCNGYKDRDYIRYALIATAMGHQVYLIIEKLSELNLVLAESQALGIKPQLGLRVRLSSIGRGKWQNSGGVKSKFGLSAAAMMQALNQLKDKQQLTSLKVLHFHMGSQIAHIGDIQSGLRESAQIYAELYRFGAKLSHVDVGGGLAIDYEGNASRNACSMNYSIEEYAHTVVKTFHDCCQQQNIPYPHLITEAGRATVAHHAVLITDVIDKEAAPGLIEPSAPKADSHSLLQSLWQVYQTLEPRQLVENYHQAQHGFAEIQSLFTHNLISLQQRAEAETIFFALLQKIRQQLSPTIRAQREILDELNHQLAAKYFLNFSVFQSIPDVWAIEQIFPIMPTSQLNQPLTESALLKDLTCDSDGRIDHYVDNQNIESTLALPPFDDDNPYHLAIFLVGAYQETLGDIHNLFGTTDSACINWSEQQQEFVLDKKQRGDTASSVLAQVGYQKELLLQSYRNKLKTSALSEAEQTRYLQMLSRGLDDSTYLL